MKFIKEKDFKKLKIEKYTKTKFLNMNLKYKEIEKVYDDETHSSYMPVEKNIRDLLFENTTFWLEETRSRLPLLIVFHKKMTNKELKKFEQQYEKKPAYNSDNMPQDFFDRLKENDKFQRESFFVKYYTRKRCEIIYYPACDILSSYINKNEITFAVNCRQEDITLNKDEIEKIYLIDLTK